MPLVIQIPCRRAIARLFGRRIRNLATATLYGSRTPRDATGDSTPVRVARVDKKHRLLQHKFFSACCDFKPQCCVYSTSTSYNSGKSCVAGINSLLSLLAVHICMVHVTTYVQRVACCPLESYSHVTNAAACRLLSTCVLFACYQCCGMPLVVHLSRIHMSPMLRHAACCPLVYCSRVTSVAACCLLST